MSGKYQIICGFCGLELARSDDERVHSASVFDTFVAICKDCADGGIKVEHRRISVSGPSEFVIVNRPALRAS